MPRPTTAVKFPAKGAIYDYYDLNKVIIGVKFDRMVKKSVTTIDFNPAKVFA